MRPLFRALGFSVAAFFIVVFVTFTFLFIKKVWFGKTGGKNAVAVVDVTGVMLGATATIREVEELLKASHVKALVIRINSPGGLVAPSQEIFEALKRADAKKPVIVSMGAVAASGGYYAALGGRKIFANPGTLTASIGVIIEFVNMEKLYQWARVERYALTAGELKGAGSPFRPMKPGERALFEGLLKDIHAQFKEAVKDRRNLSDEEVAKWTDGRVMTGRQALSAKLVDALGGYEDAIAEAKTVAGLPESAEVVFPEGRGGIMRRLLLGEEPEADSLIASLWNRFVGGGPLGAITSGWHVALLGPIRP